MKPITDDQLKEMLILQDKMNRLVEPQWLSKKFPWTRAIRVECAELTDHLGWKWWKKQEPNFPQAQIEVVDIWHFVLSHMMQESGASVDHTLKAWHAGMDFPELTQIPIFNRQFCLKGLTLHESVDMMSAFASAGMVFPALFVKMMELMGMTWEQLREQYIAKNVLNVFRQENGYKDGTYIKDWFGSEDNVRLEGLMAFPGWTAESLRHDLSTLYAEVKKNGNRPS